MAYSKRIASAIIGLEGKVYDENPKGVIAVPFNEEFKIRIINKNERKIGFDILIDDIKVTKTGRIIVSAHDKIDLERWVENDDNGTKFRFVPKNSEEAKLEGKDKEPYTGVIEIRAYLEKERPKEIIREIHHDHHYFDHHHDYPKPYIWCCNNTADFHGYSGISGWSGNTGNTLGSKNYSLSAMNCSASNFTSRVEEGAIVRGSNSNQSFFSTYVDLEEDYISLKMYIMGYYPSEKIRQKVEEMIKKEKQLEFDFMKQYCTKCGQSIKTDDNFCGKCGGKI